ncbi:inorganic pyrophosphatase [Chloroflexota bacterium]
MDFWTRLDNLIASHKIVIDRPKGSRHPRYPELVYPLDYGYLAETSGGDGNEIDVWRGSLKDSLLVAVACTVDTRKGDTELKLLIDCTDSDVDIIYRFHNENQYMSGIIIKRE